MSRANDDTRDASDAAAADTAESRWCRGNALRAAGQYADALDHYEAALQRRPAYVEAHYHRALTLHQMRTLDLAIDAYGQTLALQPDHVDALCSLGAAQWELGRTEAAQAAWHAVLGIDPSHAPSLYNLGHALHGLGQTEQALPYYDRALRSRPDYVEALCNYGLALQALNRIDEAQACYLRALQLQPALPLAHWNLALCRLTQGDFRRGWLGYEWGWAAGQRGLLREFGATSVLWRGEHPLAGKRIVLYAEQGLGDTLQFCRYAPLLARQGAQVWLEVQAPLVPLLQPLPGLAGIYAQGETPPATDYHCPLLSLPLALATELASIPAPTAYLLADSALTTAWAARLADLPRPRIGLAWSGNPLHRNDAGRSIALAQFAPLALQARQQGATLVCVQTDRRAGDAALLADFGIVDVSHALHDFADTAALLANLDHVISVDTSLAHLAGAMGRPTTLLLPYAADFRWLLARADSPWYASLSIRRQGRPGDWDSVIGALRIAPSP